jgi:hypothetical protein
MRFGGVNVWFTLAASGHRFAFDNLDGPRGKSEMHSSLLACLDRNDQTLGLGMGLINPGCLNYET